MVFFGPEQRVKILGPFVTEQYEESSKDATCIKHELLCTSCTKIISAAAVAGQGSYAVLN